MDCIVTQSKHTWDHTKTYCTACSLKYEDWANHLTATMQAMYTPMGSRTTQFETEKQITTGPVCECGSVYNRGFENAHSTWCPLWVRR